MSWIRANVREISFRNSTPHRIVIPSSSTTYRRLWYLKYRGSKTRKKNGPAASDVSAARFGAADPDRSSARTIASRSSHQRTGTSS